MRECTASQAQCTGKPHRDAPDATPSHRSGGGLSRDAIKYLAILAMTLDHIAYIFLEPMLPTATGQMVPLLYHLFLGLGSFTGPVMIYFLMEGYYYTHDPRAYAKRLLLFALVSQIPFTLAFGQLNGALAGNMLFTLLLCFGVLYVQEHEGNAGKRRRAYLLLFCLSLFTDWNTLAVPFVFFLRPAFHVTRVGAGEASTTWNATPAFHTEQLDAGKVSPTENETTVKEEASRRTAVSTATAERMKEWHVQLGIDENTLHQCLHPSGRQVQLEVDPVERRRGMGKCLLLFVVLNVLSRSLLDGVSEALGLCLGFACIDRLYSGRQAATHRRFHQYFFYVYYPAHLLLLWGLHAWLM